jgi:hypothetical protein
MKQRMKLYFCIVILGLMLGLAPAVWMNDLLNFQTNSAFAQKPPTLKPTRLQKSRIKKHKLREKSPFPTRFLESAPKPFA